uniref:DDE Tnp4 domain-containing protein n=1 Tax=Glossina palpalis gambiensis TaxID=67801 RepID=A0A1B0BBS6_9MUSC
MSFTKENYGPTINNESENISHSLPNLQNSIIQLQGGSNLMIKKIPAIIKRSNMKRSTGTTIKPPIKSKKYSLETIPSTGTPVTSFQWQQTDSSGNGISATPISLASPMNNEQYGSTMNALTPYTVIKTEGTVLPFGNNYIPNNALNNQQSSLNVTSQPYSGSTIYIRGNASERTIRTVTLELIEKNSYVHLGIHANCLPILKNVVCRTANVSLMDCYITLKKLRLNEDFSLLSQYFEISEAEIQQIFVRSVVKLSKYLRLLIRWPDSKKGNNRYKDLPLAYRQNLSHVRSLVECVETEIAPSSLQIDCHVYKYILSINTNGIISYISEAYVGYHDDLTIFQASNFKNIIPEYLSLVADPGKAIRRKRKPEISRSKPSANNNVAGETDSTTDSADESSNGIMQSDENDGERPLTSKYKASRMAGELASQQSLSVVNDELISKRVKNFSIPTMRVREPICRLQIRQMVDCLREFKVLQPLAIREPLLYQSLNEILIVCAALTNLQK